jgi:Rod binding domain-containing protein
MWRSLMVDEYGKSMAKAGGIGLADSVMSEMLRLQEAQ